MKDNKKIRLTMPLRKDRWLPLKSKYFINMMLSLILVSIMVLSSLSLVIYNQFFQEYKTNSITGMQSSISSVESMFTQKLIDMKAMTLVINRNAAFTYYPYPQESNPGTDLNIVRQLQNYTGSNPFYADIAFYRSSEEDTIYLAQGEFSLKEMQNYVFSINDPIFYSVPSMFQMFKGFSRLTGTTGEEVFAFAERLDSGEGNPRKIIYMVVYKYTIDEMISQLLPDKSYGVFILNENDDLIYSGGKESGLSREIKQLSYHGMKDKETMRIEGREYNFFYTTSEYNNWKYVVAIDSEQLFVLYNRKLVDFNLIISLVAVVVFGACAVIAVFNYTPIRRLFGKVALNFGDFNSDDYRNDEIRYIGRVVDSFIESRTLNRQRAVLSNLLWGQYDDEDTAQSDCEESALQFPYKAYVVGVLFKSEKRHSENLTVIEQAVSSMDAVCYAVGLYEKDIDAFVINYDDTEIDVHTILDHLREHVDLLSEDGRIGLGESVNRMLMIGKSFIQAKNALACLGGGQRVIRYAECMVSVQSMEVSAFKKEITSLIRHGETDDAVDKLNELLEMVYDHSVPYEKFKFVYYNVIAAFTEAINSMDLVAGEDFDRTVGELMTDSKLSRHYIGNQLERLTKLICEKVNETLPDHEDNALLERINQVIEDRLYDQLMSLEMLAEECEVSTSYLGRYFKSKTGYTPMRYVDIQRMEYAKKLLRETDESLNEIVSKSGYIDASNFIRKFKKETGITPINYRKNYLNTEPEP